MSRSNYLRNRQSWAPIAVGAGLFVAFGLRVVNLGRDSFWMDELNTALVSARPLASILDWNLDVGVHPPGHLILAHFWQALVGGSEFALRFLSVIAGMLAIAAAYRLARDLFSPPAAMLTAVLLALSNVMIYFARENRAYAWLSLLGVLGLLLTWRAVRRGGVALWVAVLGVLALASYVHYYGVFVGALAGAAVVASLPTIPPPQRWRRIGQFALVGLGAAALYLPWVPGALLQFQNRGDLGYFWSNSPTTVVRTLTAITPDLPVWLPVIVIGYALVRRTDRNVGLLAVVLALALGMVFLVNAIKVTLFYRNVILFLPAYAALLGGALVVVASDLGRWATARQISRPRPAVVAQGVLVGAVVLALVQTPPVLAWKASRPDWREVAHLLEREAAPSDLILVAQWPFSLTYYLNDPRLTERVHDALNTNNRLVEGPWTIDQPATLWWVILWLEPARVATFTAHLGPGYEVDDRFHELTVVKRRGVSSRDEALFRAGEVLEALGLAQPTYAHDPLARGLELIERSTVAQPPAARLFRATRAAMVRPRSPQLQLRLGDELLANGLEDDAAAAFERAVELEGRGAVRHEAALKLGQLRLHQARPEEAIVWFEVAIDAQPEWQFWPLLGLGEARLRLGDRLGAEQALQHAADDEMHPDRFVAVKRLAAFYRDDGRLLEARDLLARYVDQAPADPRGWLAYGESLAALGRRAEAEVAYRRTVETEPLGALAYEAAMRLGQAALERGESGSALQWYAIARERQAVWAFWPSLARGAIFRQAGQFAEAEAEIQRALAEERHPDQIVAVAELALLRAAEGRNDEARALASRVLAQGAKTPEMAERMRAILAS